MLDALDAVQLVLEDVGDRGLDDLGRRAGEHRRHRDDRRIDRRQLAVRQPRQADAAERARSRATSPSRARAARCRSRRSSSARPARRGRARLAAGAAPVRPAAAARSLRPSLTLCVPAVTIVSPGAEPERHLDDGRRWRRPISIGTRSAIVLAHAPDEGALRGRRRPRTPGHDQRVLALRRSRGRRSANRPGRSRWSALGTQALRIIRRVAGSSVGEIEEDLAREDLVRDTARTRTSTLHAVARERDRPAR